MASAEFHKWHRQNIDPQGSFQVDNFAKCWADAIKSVKASKPSHNKQSTPCPSCGGLNTRVEEYKCVDCDSYFCL